MKNLLCIFILMSLDCTFQPRQTDNANGRDSTSKAIGKTDYSEYYTTQDSIKIGNEEDTITYSKEDFNKIVDEHPEFFNDNLQDPDLLYYTIGDSKQFSSEVGQDLYYFLYGYFVRQKDNDPKYAELRRKITGIYRNINSLFQHFQYGGTYFGHQYARITAYAEFAVYQYPKNKADFQKTYNIAKQKDLYIQSIRQLITDESKIDFMSLGEQKINRTKELNEIVDSLDTLITNIFYLRKAQAFQYSHYQYF